MENNSNKGCDVGWDRGWEEHKRRQLIRASKLTLAQKLQWLEDMHILYEKLARAKKQSTREPKSPDIA